MGHPLLPVAAFAICLFVIGATDAEAKSSSSSRPSPSRSYSYKAPTKPSTYKPTTTKASSSGSTTHSSTSVWDWFEDEEEVEEGCELEKKNGKYKLDCD